MECLIGFLLSIIFSYSFTFFIDHRRIRFYYDAADFVFCITLISLCLYSIFTESSGHIFSIDAILEMTKLQQKIIFLVICQYGVDFGLRLRGYRYSAVSDQVILVHHVLGAIGILYQSYIEVGGGLMVRFLIDCSTSIPSDLETIFYDKMKMKIGIGEYNIKDLIHLLDKYSYLITRQILYTLFSIQAIYAIYLCKWEGYRELDTFWSISIIIWVLQAAFDHFS